MSVVIGSMGPCHCKIYEYGTEASCNASIYHLIAKHPFKDWKFAVLPDTQDTHNFVKLITSANPNDANASATSTSTLKNLLLPASANDANTNTNATSTLKNPLLPTTTKISRRKRK